MAFAFLLALLVILLGLLLADMRRRSRRALILQVPGGLRFEAQRFSVQVQRQQQALRVTCGRGVLTLPSAVAAPAPVPVPAGPVEHTFAAVGIAVDVRDGSPPGEMASESGRPGPFDIVIRGADGSELTIARVNQPVASTFQYFYLQVRHWIDKLEQRLERKRVARVRAEEEAAQAQQQADLMAQLLAQRPAKGPLSAAECEAMAAAQIASWRQGTGFEGLHSAHQTAASGQVDWFVDLADDGRITLRAHQRSIHNTLRGASIESNSGALEVGVRDAHWTEDEPDLQVFAVLQGRGPDERRAWKERMEILRDRLDSEAIA